MTSEDSKLSFVHRRAGHVAVTWEGLTIVWGGCEYGKTGARNEYWAPNEVLCHFEGKWNKKITRGQIPTCTSGATAQVVGSSMYVMCGFNQQEDEYNTNEIFALDLRSWVWTKLSPGGVPPLKCDKLSSWTHGGKIYGFGGFGGAPTRFGIIDGDEDDYVQEYPSYLRVVQEYYLWNTRCWNNQMFCYNPLSNRWEWPPVKNVPTPRAAHTTFICGDAVFLFGGRLGDRRLNDLYVLDMSSMVWSEMHPAAIDEGASGLPCGRSWHSFTRISSTAAVLFGGYDSDYNPLGDCWMLDIAKCKAALQEPNREQHDPPSLWTRCQHHEQNMSRDGSARLWHTSVLEPVSLRLWVIGGIINDLINNEDAEVEHPWQILAMSFSSATPLRLIAMESVIHSIGHDNPEIAALPKGLRTELEARRSHTLEERRTGIYTNKCEKGG